MQSDSNQPPLIEPDQRVAPSTEPARPHRKSIRALGWLGVLVFFGAGFFLVLHHSSSSATTAARVGGGGGRRGGGGAEGLSQ